MPSGTASGATSVRGDSTAGLVLARGGGGVGGSSGAMTWMNSVAVRGAGSSSVATSGTMIIAHAAMTCATIDKAIV
jgi:hypothetical protein